MIIKKYHSFLHKATHVVVCLDKQLFSEIGIKEAMKAMITKIIKTFNGNSSASTTELTRVFVANKMGSSGIGGQWWRVSNLSGVLMK